jgi:hypothetical protein
MTERLELSREEKYDVTIQGIQVALEALHHRIGPIECSVIEGALGYHLSILFDQYPVEKRPEIIDRFAEHLREANRQGLN